MTKSQRLQEATKELQKIQANRSEQVKETMEWLECDAEKAINVVCKREAFLKATIQLLNK